MKVLNINNKKLDVYMDDIQAAQVQIISHDAERASSSSSKKHEEKLPSWDLTDFYKQGAKDPQVQTDLSNVEKMSIDLNKKYKGKLSALSPKDLCKAIEEYEKLSELQGKIMSFAYLNYCTDLSNQEAAAFMQNAQEKLTQFSSHTIFFMLEINDLKEDIIKNPDLAKYYPWLRDTRMLKPYTLSEKEETILHETSITKHAWVRLFDETIADLRFEYEGEQLTSAKIFNKMQDQDRNVRKKAAASIEKVLSQNVKLMSTVTNTLAKDKAIKDNLRGFKEPISAMNLDNMVEDEVVETLISSVKSYYGKISHRYYGIKAKLLKLEKLEHYDRNAPAFAKDKKIFSWNEAKDIVLSAYKAFSPELAAVGAKFFENNWIDVGPKDNKNPGAFAHPSTPSFHPYLLLNFMGTSRDVMTLAHELGHGVHQVLASKQGYFQSGTPLTIAETASVFGEQLTFRYMLEKFPEERKILLANKIEDMINTVIRQIAFVSFEIELHKKRKEGELSSDQINEIWMKVQKESLGDTFNLSDGYKTFWSYVPHFIHTPFYVYSYAFGDCLVNSLYQVYKSGKVENFQDKYLEMLSAGGTLRHKELLAPFNLSASDPQFWNQGLDMISELIDELEASL